MSIFLEKRADGLLTGVLGGILLHEYENATFCCEKGEEDMKRKKFALMLAMSLTFTSFSGAGWSVYADELPEIVEDEAEDEHVWNSGTITKRPTCVETGVKTYTCLECQATYTEEIPATGVHTMTTVVDRAATCGAAGSQHRECTVCHTREASTSIPATGAHKFGAYTVTQQPTVLATGTQVRTCSVCGKTESASIPKLSGTMTLKVNSLPLQLKKTIELRNVVTGLMAGDSIVSAVRIIPRWQLCRRPVK